MKKDIYTFAEEQKKNLSRVTDVSAGICPLGPSKKVKASIRSAAKEIQLYPEDKVRRLRRYFSSKHGIAGQSILFSSSRAELTARIIECMNPERILSAGPSDPDSIKAAPGIKTVCLTGPQGSSFLPDISASGREVRKGDLLYISNPNMVCGKLVDRQQLQEVIRGLAGCGATVLLDESLIDFTADSSFYCEAGVIENLIVLRTTAFFHGLAGLELAVAVAHPSVISKLSSGLFCIPGRLTVDAAYTALTDKTYARAAKEFTLTERRQLYYAIRRIPGAGVIESDSNIFLMKVDKEVEKVKQKFEAAGFMVEDCSAIEGLGPAYLRMSVMSHDMNKKLVRLLKESLSTLKP